MITKFRNIIRTFLGDREVEDLTTSEARKLVNKFYEVIVLSTLGYRNQRAVDYCAEQALKAEGLEFFA